MTSVFLTGKENQKTVREITADPSRRFGTGIGTITDTPNFDKWDDEIADMFEVKRL